MVNLKTHGFAISPILKALISFIFLLSFLPSAFSLIIDNPLPTITTTFSEQVNVSSIIASLVNSLGDDIPLYLVSSSSDNITFKHRPTNFLSEGYYTFSIIAEDIYGNSGDLQTFQFYVTVPPLVIKLVEPRFGVSPVDIFNVSVSSNLPSDCRYAYTPISYENMNSFFFLVDNFTHTIIDFNGASINQIYSACKTSYDDSIVSLTLSLSVDSSEPIITDLSADDVFELPIETTLEVTTDELSVCAFSKSGVSFDNMSLFDGVNESDFNSYSFSHSQFLSDPLLVDHGENIFSVVCRNLAGLDSDVSSIDIDVRADAPAQITINSPIDGTFYSSLSLKLNVSTNKLASCKYSDNSSDVSQYSGSFNSFEYGHVSNSLTFSPGHYTYYFLCLFNTPEGWVGPDSSSFTIDNSPPNLVSVDDVNPLSCMVNLSDFTYSSTRLDVKFQAFDNESGVSKFNYSIFKDNSLNFSSDVIIKDWAVNSFSGDAEGVQSLVVKDLNLSDGGRYYFKFLVQNNAGIWSPEVHSDGIFVDLSLITLDGCGPCDNGFLDNGSESDIDCGGICGKCSFGLSCFSDIDCVSNFCDQNNTCNTISSTDSCFNNIKDNNESDIDCGGDCALCVNGFACNNNSDCVSNFCDPNSFICSTFDTCSNGVLDNGSESDIDCGVDCFSCENGKFCFDNSDCVSNFCDENNLCQELTDCGNGVVDVGEQCDGSLDGNSCSLFNLVDGVLSCGSDCMFNTSLCEGDNGSCDGGSINPFEQCEGDDWGKVIGCFDFGTFESGLLSCSNCSLITDQCSFSADPRMDTDGDGMTDLCELEYFNHRVRADPDSDPDGDGLTNVEECVLCNRKGSNPNKSDTDGDGHSDFKEVEKGSDPCDSLDYPKSKFFTIFLSLILALLFFGGVGYFLYSRGVINVSGSFPFLVFNRSAFSDLINSFSSKGSPGVSRVSYPWVEFSKSPPYVKFNFKFEFSKSQPFISFRKTLVVPSPSQIIPTGATMRRSVRSFVRRPISRRSSSRVRGQPSMGRVIRNRKRRGLLDSFGSNSGKTPPPNPTIPVQVSGGGKEKSLNKLVADKKKVFPGIPSKGLPKDDVKESKDFDKLSSLSKDESALGKLPVPKSKKKIKKGD